MTSTRSGLFLALSYRFMTRLVSSGHFTIRGWPVQPQPVQEPLPDFLAMLPTEKVQGAAAWSVQVTVPYAALSRKLLPRKVITPSNSVYLSPSKKSMGSDLV